MRRIIQLVIALAAIAGVVCLSAGCANRDHPTVATDGPASSPSLGLSDRTSSFHAFGTVFRNSDAVPKVTEEQAIEASGGAFGLATGAPAEIALGTLTVPTYGRETSDDPSVSVIDPFIKDRLVWVVVFNDVLQPGSGPAPATDDSSDAPDTPDEMTAGLWVAVDASSGEVIRAETIGDGED